MLVSVVIPAFNREQTIRAAVESVFAQSYSPIELIVVDDGSRDRTAAIVAEYGSRLRLLRQPNAGPSAARNRGIRAARGDIVAFLDSDDTWSPDKLARQVALLHASASRNVVCCVCNATMSYADGRQTTSYALAGIHPELTEGIWTNPAEVLVTRFLLFNQVVAVRRHAFDRVGLFLDHLRLLEDYDLALRLAAAGPWAFIRDPLVTWHGGSSNSLTSAARGLDVHRNEQEILTRFQHLPSVRHDLHRLARQRLQVIRWRLSGFELAGRSRRHDQLLGRLVLRSVRLYESIRRRQPSFPRMVTHPAPP